MVRHRDFPSIPDKRYFSISEAGKLCGVKSHVLRYWEQEFGKLKPLKRRGNRRYYRHADIELIRAIRELLYVKRYTIQGAKKALADCQVTSVDQADATPTLTAQPTRAEQTAAVSAHASGMVHDLETLLLRLESDRTGMSQ